MAKENANETEIVEVTEEVLDPVKVEEDDNYDIEYYEDEDEGNTKLKYVGTFAAGGIIGVGLKIGWDKFKEWRKNRKDKKAEKSEEEYDTEEITEEK